MKTVVFLLVTLTSAMTAGQMVPSRLRDLGDSAVKIETDTGSGSGAVVAKDTVLTCAHVIREAGPMLMVITRLQNGTSKRFRAHVVRVDEGYDLALLLVPGLGLTRLKVAQNDPEDFTTLYMVSSPLGEERTLSTQTVNKTPTHDSQGVVSVGHWHLTGAASMPGSSGGAMFDEAGELQCVFNALWIPGVMGECIDRSTVVRFLRALP